MNETKNRGMIDGQQYLNKNISKYIYFSTLQNGNPLSSFVSSTQIFF